MAREDSCKIYRGIPTNGIEKTFYIRPAVRVSENARLDDNEDENCGI